MSSTTSFQSSIWALVFDNKYHWSGYLTRLRETAHTVYVAHVSDRLQQLTALPDHD